MRLAIVDDNTELGWIFSTLASESRWRVDQFADGSELMEVLNRQSHSPYKLVLLYILMPRMTADAVVLEMGRLATKPSVALMTGGHSQHISQVETAAREAGVEIVAALLKPVPLKAVRDLLERFGRG